MLRLRFLAYAVAPEIELNKMAAYCGIPKKYTWEEPLVLQGETLEKILAHSVDAQQQVFVFAFGSVVFINTEATDVKIFIEFIQSSKSGSPIKNYTRYTDDYELRESPEKVSDSENETVITDQYAVVHYIEAYYPELIAVVIAKSVALEKIEEQIEAILDLLEGTIERLEKAKLRISDKELAKTTAKIIRHEYNTIAYIMILDKPDVTWVHSKAAAFYDRMSEFFELSDRHEIMKEKTAILNMIIDNFSSISHSFRGLFVEWLIVVLILLEILLMAADLFK
ncbi:MAG TPA: RMD1 family protein [Bacillota bacterium]|nr:RMD1 family protein [Bacillota bacterium]